MKAHEYRWIGKPIPRRDSVHKVKGETKFPSDMWFPGMLWARVLRSRYPHAWIRRIDPSKAEKLPGVVAVLTHRDVPGKNRHGLMVKDRPILADDKVRYIGDPLALVAAETLEAADRALKLIEVEYEPLPAVTDPLEALKPDAPKVHGQGNVARHTRITIGDVEEAFKKSALVVENTYRLGSQVHAFLEPEAGVATIDENGVVTVYAGAQSPHRDRAEICEALGLDEGLIRVVNPPTGGAFGGKDDITVQLHLVLLAMRTKRPVKLVWSREESTIAGMKRHAAIITMRTAADGDGRLLAHKVQIVLDTGAYQSLGPAVLDVAIENCPGPYRIPNIDVEATLVYTNSYVAGAFRGFGAPQVIFAMESQMDMIAEGLGIDPIELRLRNALAKGDIGPFGNKLEASVGIKKALEAARSHELYRHRDRFRGVGNRPWLRRGVGVAAAVKGYTIGALPDKGAVSVELGRDGRFVVKSGAVEIGQGVEIALAQIAAEALSCDINDVKIILGDTSQVPDTSTTSASRMLFLAGNAILRAAEKMRGMILEAAGKALEEPKDNLALQEGRVVSKVTGREVSYARIAELMEDREVIGAFEIPRVNPIQGSLEIPHLFFMYGVALAQVEVDVLTGFTRVLRLAEFIDAGRVINPLTFKGQVEGAMAQGIGYALMEDAKMDGGYVRTPNLSTYLIPSIKDVPEMEVMAIEDPEGEGPFGAKGIGEIGIIPVAPAIANAIYDAVGVRIKEMPATPERLYWEIKRQQA